jgi:hypothetical protein
MFDYHVLKRLTEPGKSVNLHIALVGWGTFVRVKRKVIERSIELPPIPAYLMQSMRCIGYTLETALADIIDNSITAQASRISVNYHWNNGVPWLAILDDGCGMSVDRLREAMRFGGDLSPDGQRAAHDLGRFGLGLKTASLSQCHLLTVISKQAGEISALSWDVDWLAKTRTKGWFACVPSTKELKKDAVCTLLVDELNESDTGTAVVWQKLDILVSDDKKHIDERHFSEAMSRASEHIRTVFHRFISPDDGSSAVTIDFNGTPLEPFNPFGAFHVARQELREERILVYGQTIRIQPYVLPHVSKTNRQEYERYSGDEGYLHNQGFYIYRNRRLILKGTWFRLMPRAETTKLIRVRVDIPNVLDHLWKLDVKKSTMIPPQVVLKELRRFIDKIADSGTRTYRHRAQRALSAEIPIWSREFTNGKVSYVINEKHPFAESLITDACGAIDTKKASALRLISDAFPRDTFHVDVNDDKVEIVTVVQSDEAVCAVRALIESMRDVGLEAEEVRNQLLKTALPLSADGVKNLIEELFDNG